MRSKTLQYFRVSILLLLFLSVLYYANLHDEWIKLQGKGDETLMSGKLDVVIRRKIISTTIENQKKSEEMKRLENITNNVLTVHSAETSSFETFPSKQHPASAVLTMTSPALMLHHTSENASNNNSTISSNYTTNIVNIEDNESFLWRGAQSRLCTHIKKEKRKMIATNKKSVVKQKIQLVLVIPCKKYHERHQHGNFMLGFYAMKLAAMAYQVDFSFRCEEDKGQQYLLWWEVLILRNSGKGSSACVIRVHHVIGDGLALVSAFEKILTNEDGTPIVSPTSLQSGGAKGKTKKKNDNKNGILSTVWSLIEATGHVLTLSATKYDDDTAFSKMNHSNMRHSGKREAVIFPTVPLDFVKKLKDAANVTVNDLLMTAVSQAIHDYCESQDDVVLSERGSSIQCRALLPVGFPRSLEELNDPSTALRNIWCMVSCDIGVGISNIEERLRHVHSKTTEMKEKPRAFMQLKVQNKFPGPYVPTSLGQQTVFDTFSRHSLVLTNVPGPSKKCLFAGKLVESVQLFFDNFLTQVDLISYAGQVYGNIVLDADELPNSEIFGRLYIGALMELANTLNVDVPAEVKKAAACA